MRLPEGIKVDNDKTFGELKFSALRRTRFKEEGGEVTTEVTSRTYDLRCKVQGEMIQVTLPPEIPEKTFEYGAVVELVEPEVGTVADRGGVTIFIRAKDIALKGKGGNRPTAPTQPQNNHQTQPDKKE
nr:YdcP family protein [Scatolibacter rhodanostii]